MRYTETDLLQRTTLPFVAEIIADSTIEYEPAGKQASAEMIQESLLQEIKDHLKVAVTDQNGLEQTLDLIEWYCKTRETMAFTCGMKAGGKLVRELIFD